MVTTIRRKTKMAYFRNYFLKYKKDSSKIWIGINQALESSKSMKQIPLTVKDIKNEIVSDPQIKIPSRKKQSSL